MRILLIKPYNLSDHIQPSLGLGWLAASIRDKYEVKILDCIKENVDIDKLGQYIKEFKPDVFGTQCYTFDLQFVKAAFKLVKDIDKNIITMIGGPHPSAMPIETMDMCKDTLDFLFQGEAEIGLGQLLDMIGSGGRDFSGVAGLTWREGGQIRSNPKVVTENLDFRQMPAWDLIKPQTYPESQHGAFFKKFPIAPIMITRGCPYPCTFCAGNVVSGKKIRRRSIDNVIAEISELYKNFGIREFHVIDDNFTADSKYAKDFLRRLKSLDLDISWAVPNGVRMDTLDEEILSMMKETGLYLISLGIESGSDDVLKSMKKGTTTKVIREKVKLIRDSGIDIAGFFILGFPGETEETIRQTIEFSKELDLVRANFFTYLPFPGSASYAELKANGELSGVDWERFYFMNAAYTPKGLSRSKLKSLHRSAFREFYFRPRIVLYNLCAIKSLRHASFLAKRFFHWILMN